MSVAIGYTPKDGSVIMQDDRLLVGGMEETTWMMMTPACSPSTSLLLGGMHT